MTRKLLILVIKYIPTIQMVGMLFSNLLYFAKMDKPSYVLDYLFGNSITITTVLVISSYVFKFCTWHRLIIFNNIVIVSLSLIDSVCKFPVSNVQLLIVNYAISVIFIILAINSHVKDKRDALR